MDETSTQPEVAPAAQDEDAVHDPVVQLSKDESVQLSCLLTFVDRGCNLCNGMAVVRYVTAKGTESTICGCAVVRYRKKARAAARSAPVPTVGPVNQEHWDRSQRRIAALRADADELAADFATRKGVLDAEVAAILESVRDAAVDSGRTAELIQDIDEDIVLSTSEVVLLEGRLAAERLTHAGLRSRRDDAVAARDKANAAAISRDAEIQALQAQFEKNTEGLRKRIEKARRRLALAIARASGAPMPAQETSGEEVRP